MATETLEPDAEESGVWTVGAGSDKTSAVQLPDDDDTSYITDATAGNFQRYTMENPSDIGAGDTINSVTLHWRSKGAGGSKCCCGIRIDAGTEDTSAVESNSSSYANFSYGPRTTDPYGGAWSLADLQNLQMQVNNSANKNCMVTTMYVVVDYTPGSTGPKQGLLLRGVG